MGTSSGALAGKKSRALWAAGFTAEEVANVLGDQSSLAVTRKLCSTPWQGLFSLSGLVDLLRDYLPPTFEELLTPLAVGVLGSGGYPELLDSGPLPEAVAASLAVPFLFAPVSVNGIKYHDGGVKDRTGLGRWVRLRPEERVLVHLVDSSRGRKGDSRSGVQGWHMDPSVMVIRSDKSGASIFRGLGDFEGERIVAMKHALQILDPSIAKSIPLIYPDDFAPYLSLLEAADD
ncbi:unnamed protein product [Choristocarpus tenellus]